MKGFTLSRNPRLGLRLRLVIHVFVLFVIVLERPHTPHTLELPISKEGRERLGERAGAGEGLCRHHPRPAPTELPVEQRDSCSVWRVLVDSAFR